MTGCLAPQAPVWLSPAPHPARKLAWTLELVAAPPSGELVGVNTLAANRLAAEAAVDELHGAPWARESLFQKGGEALLLGGAVGFVAYDYVRTLERIPDRHPDTLGLPLFDFVLADPLVCLA